MIVDDEPVNLQVLNNYLSLAHYQVTSAQSGPEALAMLKHQPEQFHLVVLDVMMPHMSGYEVNQKIRQNHPKHKLPVIMLTAKNQVSDLVAGYEAGANDYLTKPFSRDELLMRIQAQLNLSRAAQAFGRFVPREYLAFFNKKTFVEVERGDHLSGHMGIMFSDIRGFTSMSEKMTARENFDFINQYLEVVNPPVRDNQGIVVKFMGDGLMAVFPNRAEDGLQAGLMTLHQLAHLNRENDAQRTPPIRIGLGLHFGHIMVGIVGDENRVQSDAMSDNVNLAARLEGLTKYYGTPFIISGSVYDQLPHPEKYHLRFIDHVIVVGREQPIKVYEVLDALPAQVRQIRLQTQPQFEVGLRQYHIGDLKQATVTFAQILSDHPDDAVARLYMQRINEFHTHGLPEDWNGITRMAQK